MREQVVIFFCVYFERSDGVYKKGRNAGAGKNLFFDHPLRRCENYLFATIQLCLTLSTLILPLCSEYSLFIYCITHTCCSHSFSYGSQASVHLDNNIWKPRIPTSDDALQFVAPKDTLLDVSAKHTEQVQYQGCGYQAVPLNRASPASSSGSGYYPSK